MRVCSERLPISRSWKGAKVGQGRARGVAVHKSFDTYVAQIAEVSVGNDGLPKVEHVWCAVDCGVAVNPEVIKAQMEGGIGFGLGAILFDEITLDQGPRRAGELQRLSHAAHRRDAQGRRT